MYYFISLTTKLPRDSLSPVWPQSSIARNYRLALWLWGKELGWDSPATPKYKLEVLNLCSDEQHWYNYRLTRFFFYLSASNYMVICAIYTMVRANILLFKLSRCKTIILIIIRRAYSIPVLSGARPAGGPGYLWQSSSATTIGCLCQSRWLSVFWYLNALLLAHYVP